MNKKNPPPVLLLEINEIPWRVLNHYRNRFPHIKEFFRQAREMSTLTVDEGELSPWVTWPSFHRGLSNKEHRVFNLGQDPSTFKGTPIWEEYRRRGFSIGVFGSMQSWPARDPGQNGFYIPDTFAHDEKCIPSVAEPLQRFNLDQVAQNGRVVSGSPLNSALKPEFFLALLRCGVRPRTLVRLAKQLLQERLNPDLKARRPVYQTVLFWDVFKHLYNPENPPAFATFFTNHVAGVMHRYWNHLYPEDFPLELRPKRRIHHETMDFAMGILDELLKDVLIWMRKNPQLSVIFATSMGQAAIHRLEHTGYEAVVREIDLLMKALGLEEGQFEPLLAMVPQVAVAISDASIRGQMRAQLEAIKTHSQKQLFRVQEIGNSLSITLINPTAEDCQKAMARLPNGLAKPFSEIGIKVWQTEAGTAYHIPEGILAIAGPLKERFTIDEDTFPADRFKGLFMKAVGFNESTEPSPRPTEVSADSSENPCPQEISRI